MTTKTLAVLLAFPAVVLAAESGWQAKGHNARVAAVAFSPDGRILASAGGYQDGAISLRDSRSGVLLKRFGNHFGGISAIAFTSDGRKLVSAGWEGLVLVWEIPSGRLLHRLVGHIGGVGWVAIAPDGSKVVAASLESRIYIWDVDTEKLLHRMPNPEILARRHLNRTPAMLAFSPDGSHLAFVVRSKSNIFLINVEKAHVSRRIPVARNRRERVYGVNSFAFTANGRGLVVDAGGAVVLVDIRTGTRRQLVARGRNRAGGAYGQCMAMSPDQLKVVTADAGLMLSLWDAATGKRIWERRQSNSPATCTTFSPDNRRFAVGTLHGEVATYDPRGLFPPREHPHLNHLQLSGYWNVLAKSDPAAAHRAVFRMADSPAETITFLQDRIQPFPAMNAERISRQVAELDNRDYLRRKQATHQLIQWGGHVMPALREVINTNPSLELRQRADIILQKVEENEWGLWAQPRHLQSFRAIEVLERIGTRDAQQLLAKLANGAAGIRQTEAAKAALERLKQFHHP